MKRIISFSLIMCLVISLISAETFAQGKNQISVYVDGTQISFDVEPQLIDGRTMVPLRAIFEALNASVEWDDKTQTVTSIKDGTIVCLTIDKPILKKNDAEIVLDVPPMLVDKRTLVPVRAVAESFDAKVDWDDMNNSVNIVTNVEHDDINAVNSAGENISEEGIYYNGSNILDFGVYSGVLPIRKIEQFGIAQHVYDLSKLPENTVNEYVNEIKQHGFTVLRSTNSTYEFFDSELHELKLYMLNNQLYIEYIYDDVSVESYADNENVPDFGIMIGKSAEQKKVTKKNSGTEYVYTYADLIYEEGVFTHDDYIRYLEYNGFILTTKTSDKQYFLKSYNTDQNYTVTLKTTANGKKLTVVITVCLENMKRVKAEDNNTYYGTAQWVKKFSNVYMYKEDEYKLIRDDKNEMHYYCYAIDSSRDSTNLCNRYVKLLINDKFVEVSSDELSCVLENNGINQRVNIYNDVRCNKVIIIISKIDNSKKDGYYDDSYFDEMEESTILQKYELMKYISNATRYWTTAIRNLSYFIEYGGDDAEYYNEFFKYKELGTSEIRKAHKLCYKYSTTIELGNELNDILIMLSDMTPSYNYEIYNKEYLLDTIRKFKKIAEDLDSKIIPYINLLPNNWNKI